MKMTALLLMVEFEEADIPLEKVAEKYLGMKPQQAARKAKQHELPFPTFRAGSQKSSYLVNVADLAKFIDDSRAAAEREWKLMNS